MQGITTYLKHVREEFKHLTWPTTRTAIAHTVIVILIAVAITVLVGVADYIFSGSVSHIVAG